MRECKNEIQARLISPRSISYPSPLVRIYLAATCSFAYLQLHNRSIPLWCLFIPLWFSVGILVTSPSPLSLLDHSCYQHSTTQPVGQLIQLIDCSWIKLVVWLHSFLYQLLVPLFYSDNASNSTLEIFLKR